MSRYETDSSQFGLVSGIRQPASDRVLVAEPASLFAPEARKGRLYLIAETTADAAGGRDACQLVLKTIRKVFYEDSSYSVTSALRKAIQVANRALYQHNFSAPPQKRAVVGLSCAVIKDQDLYLAQVLPAQAYVLSAGKLRALPAIAAWGGAPASSAPRPGALGFSLTTEPDFYRAVLHPGDSLLLCSSNLAALLGRDQTNGLLRSDNAAAAVEELVGLCKEAGLGEAHGIGIRLAPPLSPAAQAAPLSPVGVAERSRLLARAAGARVARLTGELARLARPGAHEQQTKTERRLERGAREQELLQEQHQEPELPLPSIPRPRELHLGESLEERVVQERQSRLMRASQPAARPTEETPPSAFLGEHSHYSAAPERRIDLSDTPGMAALGAQGRYAGREPLPIDMTLGERLMLPLRRASEAVGRASQRRRMRRPPPSAMRAAPRPRGLSYRREGPQVPWVLLLALLVLVGGLVVYGRMLVTDNARREALEALDQAERAVAAVRDSPDEAAAERQLDAARLAINRVQSAGVITSTAANRERLDRLQRDYEQNLAAVQKLTYFDDLAEIGRHPQAGAGGTFQSIVVPPPPNGITNTLGFSSIYALDSNSGVLYTLPKAGGAIQPFLSPDDSYLPGLRVGKVRAIAWRLDNIVAIAQSNEGPFIYYFRAGERWNGSNLGGSTEWNRIGNTPFHLVTYAGNLYVWGAVPGQVLKYVSGQPADPYDPWIKDASRATDTAIDLAIDGNVYLLQPGGGVLVYEANAFKREIAPPALKQPLVTASGFAVSGQSPEAGSIFLLDTANERLIEIDKVSGQLIQQIRTRPDSDIRLNALATFFIDDSGPQKQVYLVNGSQILRASLPPPPPPFRAVPTPSPAGAGG